MRKLNVHKYACLMLATPLASTIAMAQSNAGAETEIETIVVEGEQLQQALIAERDLTPGAVSLLDADDLFERGVVNMADALRYTPGVWSISTSGSDSTFLSSRGSNLDATNYDMNGIKLLQDGLPVTTADGNNHNRMIDPLATRFASIARGANALTYGASTLGGAMNFTSPTARDSAQNQLFLNAGSFDLQAIRASMGRVFNEQLDGYITVDEKRREGYRGHDESERSSVYANLGWRINENIENRTYLTYSNYDQELPGGLTAAQLEEDRDQSPPDAYTGDYQYDVLAKRIANKTTIDLASDSSFEFGVSRESQDLFHPIVDVRVDFDGPGPMAPQQVFSLLIDTEQVTTGAMARYNTNIGDHNLLFGMNWGKSTVKGGNYTHDHAQPTGLSTIVDNSAESVELFAMDRWSVTDRTTLIYGLQAVDTSRDVKNIDAATNTLRNPVADYDSINPRAGVIYQLTDQIDVFANISRLYEAPTNYELEDDVRGNNSTLDAMRGTVVEVGTRGQQSLSGSHSWNWDLSLYYGELQDEILSQDDPAAPGTSLSTNVDDTIHAGVEALVAGEFYLGNSGRLEPMLSLTWNEFKFDNDPLYGNGSLPAAPQYALRGEVMYRMENGFFAGPTFDLVDERYVDFTNSRTVDSYRLFGMRAGVDRDNWRAFIEVKNITDEEYVSQFSVVNQYTADSAIFHSGEPRALFAGVQMSF